jgi:hypothetical protein
VTSRAFSAAAIPAAPHAHPKHIPTTNVNTAKKKTENAIMGGSMIEMIALKKAACPAVCRPVREL